MSGSDGGDLMATTMETVSSNASMTTTTMNTTTTATSNSSESDTHNSSASTPDEKENCRIVCFPGTGSDADRLPDAVTLTGAMSKEFRAYNEFVMNSNGKKSRKQAKKVE